jgi:hypothetical protein
MAKYRPGADGKWQLEWIDKNAVQGPVFRIGPDIYSRVRADERALELKAILSPGLNYLDAANEAFRELASHWQAPICFIINPDVTKPPAVQFLYRWSQESFQNGSVDRSFMLTGNMLSQYMGRFVLKAFTNDMPFVAVNGRDAMDSCLDELDLSCGRPDFVIRSTSTAMVPFGGGHDGAFQQLFRRLLSRLKSGSSA